MNAFFQLSVPGIRRTLSVICAAQVFAIQWCLGAAAPIDYSGKYTSEELSLEAKATADQFAGIIVLGKQRFPFTARETDGRLRGSFRNGNAQFKFEAVLEDDKLTLTTDGTTYQLTKQPAATAKNPLAKSAPANPLARSSELATATTNANVAAQNSSPAKPSGGPGHGPAWKTFRHPTGLSMSYPPDWKLNELPSALQMIPPDPGSNADGPTEAYLVMAEGAQVTSLDDPRVLQYLDSQMAQLAPFMRRSGRGESIRAASAPGLLVTWAGSNPRGLELRAQAFATILKGYGVVLFALGEKDRINRREPTLRAVFASFAASEGQKDPQVVGAWRFWSYSSGASGNYSTEQSRLFVLRGDGTCLWSSRTDTSTSLKGRDSLGNDTWVAGTGGTGSDTDKGTWSAGEGKLFVLWQDGSLGDWTYQVTGAPGNRRLLLKGNKDKPDEWVEAQ